MHQFVVLPDFLFFFVFVEVKKQKSKIGDTQGETHEFYGQFVAGIEQIGKFGKGIVRNIIDSGQKTYNIQFLSFSGKDSLCRMADESAKQKEGDDCN